MRVWRGKGRCLRVLAVGELENAAVAPIELSAWAIRFAFSSKRIWSVFSGDRLCSTVETRRAIESEPSRHRRPDGGSMESFPFDLAIPDYLLDDRHRLRSSRNGQPSDAIRPISWPCISRANSADDGLHAGIGSARMPAGDRIDRSRVESICCTAGELAWILKINRDYLLKRKLGGLEMIALGAKQTRTTPSMPG